MLFVTDSFAVLLHMIICKRFIYYIILSINWEKIEISISDLKITLISKIGRVLIILFFTRMLKSNDTISRNDQTKTKSFWQHLIWLVFQLVFYWENWCNFLSVLLFLLNDTLPYEIFKNQKQLKALEIIKPTLYCLQIKLLKFKYTPLKTSLWYTNVLKPLLILVIKMYKKSIVLLYSFSHLNLLFLCLEFKDFFISQDYQVNETKQLCHQHIFCIIQVWTHRDTH